MSDGILQEEGWTGECRQCADNRGEWRVGVYSWSCQSDSSTHSSHVASLLSESYTVSTV